jgi:hypothetical protein
MEESRESRSQFQIRFCFSEKRDRANSLLFSEFDAI